MDEMRRVQNAARKESGAGVQCRAERLVVSSVVGCPPWIRFGKVRLAMVAASGLPISAGCSRRERVHASLLLLLKLTLTLALARRQV